MGARRAVFTAALVGLGALLHLVEGLVQYPAVVPGAKLGLANLATLVALELGGPSAALVVAVTRPVVAGLAGGTLLSLTFVLSLSGAMASALVMTALRRSGRRSGLSLVGVSLTGGVAHNLGQLASSALFIGPAAALGYVGPLVIAGLFSGYLVGRLGGSLVSRVAPLVTWRTAPPGKCSTATIAS